MQSNNMMGWVAVIPIRDGSKGLPGKNIKNLIGKPLYMHTVDQAIAAGAERVVITTNISEVIHSSHDLRVTVLVRPDNLCSDSVPMVPVLAHAIKAANIQGPVGLLQATSPLRSVASIKRALSIWQNHSYEMVMSVSEADKNALKSGFLVGDEFIALGDPEFCFSNRQALPDIYKPNGAIFIMDAQKFITFNSFVFGKIGTIKMPKIESIDIDTASDFEVCEEILAKRGANFENR